MGDPKRRDVNMSSLTREFARRVAALLTWVQIPSNFLGSPSPAWRNTKTFGRFVAPLSKPTYLPLHLLPKVGR